MTKETKTETGSGFLPLFSRAWTRSIIVANAMFRGWPISNEVASAELEEGREYINKIDPNIWQFVTSDTSSIAAKFTDQYEKASRLLLEAATAQPKEQTDRSIDPELKQLTMIGWELMSRLDHELLGLSEDATDPGRRL